MTHLLRICEFFCAPRRARSPEIPKRMNRIFALVTRVCTFLGIPCHKWKFGPSPPPSPPLAYYSKLQFFCSENVLSPKRVLQKNTDSSEKCPFYSLFHTKLFVKIRKFLPIFVNRFREFFGLLAGVKFRCAYPPRPGIPRAPRIPRS